MKAILIHQDGNRSTVDVTIRRPMSREQIAADVMRNMNTSGLINKVTRVIVQA